MAASIAENLDLITEILLRLPVKPLLRFKCVCKQWLSLISNPRFCHAHTLRQYQTHPFPTALLLAPIPPESEGSPSCPIIPLKNSADDRSTVRVHNFDFLNVPSHLDITINIMQSCNGLLLVEAQQPRLFECSIPDPFDRYFVCNPTTKQFLRLIFPRLKFEPRALQLYLDFNPMRSLHYKVILIRFKGLDEPVNNINVYSSETGSWSDLGVCFPSQKLFYNQGIYCNGAIHWCADVYNSLFFDMETQCLKTFPMPSNIQNYNVRYCGESSGYLCMILESFENPTQVGLDILELKEDYSGWSLRFHVDLDTIKVAFPGLHLDYTGWDYMDLDYVDAIRSIHVVSIVRQEKEEDSMFVFCTAGRAVSYNHVDCTFRQLGGFEPFLNLFFSAKVFQYFENLSSV